MRMQNDAVDAQPPNVQVDALRFLQKPGAKLGTLSVVVGGVHYMWKCSRSKMFIAIESAAESLRRGEESA